MMGIVEHCLHDLNLGSSRARNWCFIINMMIIRTELHIQTQSSCCNLHSLGFSFSSLISDFWHKHVANNMSDTGVGMWFISAWWDWCFSLFLKETCLHMFPVLIFTCPVIMWQKAWENKFKLQRVRKRNTRRCIEVPPHHGAEWKTEQTAMCLLQILCCGKTTDLRHEVWKQSSTLIWKACLKTS